MKSIGIDIGGTTIKGALFDDMQIIKEFMTPTNGKLGREKILVALRLTIDHLLVYDVQYIGIDSAGNIDPYTGMCVYASNNLTGWTGFNIKEYVENSYNVPTYVENDAVAALWAETYENKDDFKEKNICLLTIGTGLGCVVMEHNHIYYGEKFDEGAYAHICVNPHGLQCDCGRCGCAEKELSATGLLNYGQMKIENLKDVKELFNLYRNNDQRAVDVITDYGDKLNYFLAVLTKLKNIDLFIIGGGVASSRDVFQKIIKSKAKIVYAKHSNRAGVIGANLLGKLQNEYR